MHASCILVFLILAAPQISYVGVRKGGLLAKGLFKKKVHFLKTLEISESLENKGICSESV